MKKFAIISSGLIVALVMVGTYIINTSTVSGTWRYKMTVVVETPEGLKSGSAVREVSNARTSLEHEIPHVTHSASAKGEAIVVDLGHRGKLFALLSGYHRGPDYADSVLYSVFPTDKGGTTPEGIRYYRDLKAGPKVLTLEQYPVLVMFRDINDPKTVVPVLELSSDKKWPPTFSVKANHFEELFGKGVRLKEITIEMTDEPVTWSMSKILPWLNDFYDTHFDGNRFQTIKAENRFANSLSSGAFSTGDKKDN